MDIVEEIEKKANANGWYFRKLNANEPCAACNRPIDRGFVLSPGQNYPICLQCAKKEFGDAEQKKA